MSKIDENHIISSIANLKKDYDEVLGKVRDEHTRQTKSSILWTIKPFLRALFNYSPFSPGNTNSLATKVSSSSLLQNLGAAAFLTDFLIDMSDALQTFFIVISILLYLISVVSNFKRQITITDEYFDISAFRSLEKVIHNKLVSKYIDAAPFTFSMLYDYLRDLARVSGESVQELLTENQKKAREIQVLRDELEKSKISVTELRKSLKYQIELQSHLNQTLLRIINGTFNRDDLMLVCKFSLFREEGNDLVLDASHGLTRTPGTLHLDELTESQKTWAVVSAYLDEEEDSYRDISHNRVVVAKRFKMTDNTVYVYSYHFDVNKEADYGIIKTEEADKALYTLISYWHSQHTLKEDELNEQSNN